MRMVGGIPAGREGVAEIVGVRYLPASLRAPPISKTRGGNGGWKTAGGTRGHEDLACRRDRGYPAGRGRGGAERGRTGSTRLAARAPPISKKRGGNGGWKRRAGRVRAEDLACRRMGAFQQGGRGGEGARGQVLMATDSAGMPPISPTPVGEPFYGYPETSRSTLGVYPGHFAKFLYAQVVPDADPADEADLIPAPPLLRFTRRID
ncbi:hypothetical protein B0H14DRAFT_2646797 [Mycena olivaceomarginata]|nr:hypothetical protein B0H14DRAFT_2646797 [Mycena olivaceomarginata]